MAVVAEEVGEEVEFAGGGVEGVAGEGEDGLGAGGAAAEEGADAGGEFGEGEGFDEVVAGAQVEAEDAVFDGVAGGEEEDGGGEAAAADGGEDFEAGAAGEHDVEDDEVEGLGVELEEGFFAGGGERDGVGLGFEAFAEGAGDFGFVFDYEDAHGGWIHWLSRISRRGWECGGMSGRGPVIIMAVEIPEDLAMTTIKLTTMGSSTGAVIPEEMLARLKVEKGDALYAVEMPEGYLLTPYDPAIDEQRKAGQRFMKDYRNTFKALAK